MSPRTQSAVRAAVRAEVRPQLVDRVRAIVLISCGATLLALLVDHEPRAAYPSPLFMLRVTLCVAYGALALLAGLLRRVPWGWAVTGSVLAMAVPCAGIVAVGVVTGDQATGAYLLMTVCIAGSIVFPWGREAQVGCTLVAAVGLAVLITLVGGDVGFNRVFSFASGLVASIYVAHTLEQQRLERARAELLRAGHARVLELAATGAGLPATLDELLRTVEEQAPALRSSILLADPDAGTLRHCAAPGLSPDFTRAVDGLALAPGTIHDDRLARAIDDFARQHALALCWAVPIVSGGGHPLGAFVAYRPATHEPSLRERHLVDTAIHFARIAIEREQSRRRLERYVAALDDARVQAETQARELALARDAALASTRAKSDFLATMSHEIRTPMNGIFGMTEMALDTTDDTERREFLQRARSCAETLMTVLNDVLDFSKIEAGRVDLESIVFDPRNLVDGVLDTLAVEASRKGLELIGFVEADVPNAVRGDPGRLRQVLVNLAANAVKFTPRGEVELRVTRDAAQGDAGLVLRVEVRDTGIGIPPEKLGEIFDAFTQADSSTTRCHGGTGLGLAISRRLVILMGGTIDVESTPGLGSRFWCTVPLAETPTLAVVPRVPPAGLRVLVVDDNAANRLMLVQTLQAYGLWARSASSGAEACEVLAQAARTAEPFAAALVDLQMPGVDGVETARRLRADPATKDVALILLRSIGGHPGAIPAEVEVAAVLAKPVKQRQLLETLARVAGVREARNGRSGARAAGSRAR